MSRLTRRGVVGALGAAAPLSAAAAGAGLGPAPNGPPEAVAADAGYWGQVSAQYDVTREITNLENGNWGVMARPVLAEHLRQVERVNRLNAYYARREFGPEFTAVRRRVAAALGASPDEIAITRNATEALQALIGGYNRLKPGDQVLYADVDYTSMQYAMNWLRERRGVEVATFALPEPSEHDAVLAAYDAALKAHPRARLLLLTHVSHRNGLAVPVREIAAMSRAQGVDVIVDAAHSWGQMDFRIEDLGVDFAGFNLHKWLGAPLGVGFLYIRRNRLTDVDRFMDDEDAPASSVASRVHTGTSDYAAVLTVPAALDFHERIGVANKAARLRRLRALWTEPLRGHPRIEILTPADPRMSAGITSFRLKDRRSAEENVALARTLLDRYGVFTVHRTGLAGGACVRVTPALYNTDADVMKLEKALLEIAANA